MSRPLIRRRHPRAQPLRISYRIPTGPVRAGPIPDAAKLDSRDLGLLNQCGASLPHGPAGHGHQLQLCHLRRCRDCGLCLGVVVGWCKKVSYFFWLSLCILEKKDSKGRVCECVLMLQRIATEDELHDDINQYDRDY